MKIRQRFLSLLVLVAIISLISANPVQSKTGKSDDPACVTDYLSELQQITFHENEDYTGNSQSFCSNNANIQSLPGCARTSRVFCVDRGVWIINFLNKDGVPSVEGILASGNIGRLCIKFPPESNLRFTSVRHLAAAKLNDSTLSLYKERYRGAEFRFDGKDIRLPAPVPVKSFALTGYEGLTIFSGTDFNGDSECLKPGPNDPFHLGLSFSDDIAVRSVGSVRRGCFERRSESGKENPRAWLKQRYYLQGEESILAQAKIEIF